MIKRFINALEAPILYAANRAMSLVYRQLSVAPPRQVIMWEMIVASIEVLLVAYAFSYFFKGGVGPLLYVLPIMIVSRSISIVVEYLRLRHVPKSYNAAAYRQACTNAQRHREISGILRLSALFLVAGALMLFALVSGTSFAAAGLGILVYFILYSSIFYVRAAEPPHPDEGDFFALPAGSSP